MASDNDVSKSYSVGQISQLLSTSGKRKNNHEENSCLKSLFSVNLSEQPVFIEVRDKKNKKRITVDTKNQEESKSKRKKIENDLEIKLDEKNNDTANNKTKRTKLKPQKSKEDPERLKRTIFVGNVPVTLKKKALKKLFNKYGEVESVRFRSAALAKPSMSRTVGMKRKEYHKDRQALNGYIVFKDQSSACDALQSNGHEVEGRHIRVDIASNDKVHNHARSVFVGNLPFGTEEEPLRELFNDCGEIESVRLIRDSKTNIGKGFGFVLFKSKDAVGFAIKLNQTQFDGRPIRVFPSSEHPKKGYLNKAKKGKPMTHSFSGLQAKKNQKVNKSKHAKIKENVGKKKGARKRAGKNVGQPTKRSVAYKQKLNKKIKTK